MSITTLRRYITHAWHRHGSMNNIVMAVALVVAASWAWGSIATMQRNFALQKDLDARKRELQLTDLEVQTLQYQQNYYKSDEYKALAAREHLGLANPGEKVLLLPVNSDYAKQVDAKPAVTAQSNQPTTIAGSNFEQWMNFFAGNAARSLQ
ncbi:MAG: hypothetical protein WAQ25_04060 [Candidatus Saccharimonas sp.]